MMDVEGSILIVEDDVVAQKMLQGLLRRKLGYNALTAGHGREALTLLRADQGESIRLIILDLEMPVMGGMETLDIVRRQYPHIPVVMLTGSQDVGDAVEALKHGAVDFLTKPYDGERLVVSLKNAMKIGMLTKEVSRLKGRQGDGFSFDDLVGSHGGLLQSVQVGRKAAGSDIPVLITGKTGTGKEIFARAVHGESTRAKKPFVAVNCGAIPAQLIESTLFGHEKGAFTGAIDKAMGKFREAEGGTIFLDEVGELTLDAQVKLLRVLQQKEVEPVGGAKAVHVNVRVLSATNRDLAKEVREGRFREDLYFRLNVLHIDLPSLKKRKQDIPLLAHAFVERFCVDHNVMPKDISKEVYEMLEHYDWPGNVRELENAINRAMVVAERNVLKVEDFVMATAAATPAEQPPRAGMGVQMLSLMNEDGGFKSAEQIEHEVMMRALEYYQGNITRAAKEIGMAKSTFYKKLDKINNLAGKE